MKEIKRDIYLDRLIGTRENGLIKIITGIRRCGKSYLLDPIFKNYLIKDGVSEDHIIKIELDRKVNEKFHNNAEAFDNYLHSLMKGKGMYYLILDEIQLVQGFELVLNGLLYDKNVDIYVTGSNSKFLSSDIITEFRGRGDRIHINPFSFLEFQSGFSGDKFDCLNEYMTYGGMPLILSRKSIQEKVSYLKDLFEYTYIKDIVERNGIKRIDVLDTLVDILASCIGSLTNPQKICNTFKSNGNSKISVNTITSYLSYIENSFIVKKAMRYDVKGRKYIGALKKYYFSDLGLRNARINFRQSEETHLIENLIYNELMIRGYNVDVGVVELKSNGERVQTEVDFVCNLGDERYYIQSALSVAEAKKLEQEVRPMQYIDDNFKKIIIVKDYIKPRRTEKGIFIIGVLDFIQDYESLKKLG